MNGLGGRPVLDELHQIVLEHHVAGCVGQIVAHLKGVRVGHAERHRALSLVQITQQVCQASQEVLAPCLDGCAQHFRIAQDEVAGGQGVGHLAGEKTDFPSIVIIQIPDIVNGVHNPAS